jgi:integrase
MGVFRARRRRSEWKRQMPSGSCTKWFKECCRLRVKDVDLERLQLAVRSGKGDQDRVTVLPRRLVDRLREQIERVRRLHEDDLALGFGRVWLPPALRRKYPNAERELGWQLHVMEGGTTDVRSPLDLLDQES